VRASVGAVERGRRVLGGVAPLLLAGLAWTACARHDAAATAGPAPSASSAPPATTHDAAPPSRDAPPASDTARGAASDAAPDLTADLARRARAARARFGAAARVRTAGDAFLLVETGGRTPLFEQTAALLDRVVPALFDGRFSTRPEEAVTVLLFTSHAAYVAWCAGRCGGPGQEAYGIYFRPAREIAADLSRGAAYVPTLAHEVAHPLLQTDFPRAPLWFEEAVASLYEAPVFARDGSLHGEARNWRHEQLQEALATKAGRETVRLDRLFAMTTREFRAIPPGATADKADPVEYALHYATARSFAAWMDRLGKLWPFYRAWRDGVDGDPTGDKAFERVMGGTPGAKTGEWVGWAR